ncbi:TetR family transcriptional regulator [Metasolibacillus meyeri]|uniref:TetR family transcriptional regulator n=1 Tax=Metasolibacillus meyeri TaxID=1071052 RepID=A0AAW9NJK1_9BACL|nr:TetR family transcriptional regulator [Metasolibacillus meyeri]MEC1177902.1 TetR family transcriptional regulator [Metasolibacillus meyeri]
MSKKEKIVQAAISVFRENGIAKTKVSDIVKAAGIAQGTFYLYFPSLLSIMPAIAKEMVDKMEEVVEQKVEKDASFEEQIVQVVDAIFDLVEEHKDIFAIIYAGIAQTEHIKEWENIYAPFYEWMHEFLESAQQQGMIRLSFNVKQGAKIVIGLIEVAAEQIFLYDESTAESVQEQKTILLDFLYNALGMRHV